MLNVFTRKTGEEAKEQHERAAMMADAINSKTGMPDEKELEVIGKLREQFREQLEKRKEAGTHWEFFFGDLAMARIFRGCGEELDAATVWLARCLKTFDEKGIDNFAKKAKAVVDAGPLPQNWLVDCCGLAPESGKLVNFCFFNDAKLSTGDRVMYIPVADLDKKALAALPDAGWSNFMDSLKMQNVITSAVLDKESKQEGRMNKIYTVFDFKYTTIAGLMCKEYDSKLDSDYSKIAECIAAEQMRALLAINLPWWVTKLYSAMTSFLPEKFTAKIKLFSPDDPAVYQIVPEEMMSKIVATRIGKQAGITGDPQGEIEIGAGCDFEYAASVTKGQTISWKFKVESSDIRFSGLAFWTDATDTGEDKDASTGAEIVVPQASVTSDDGEVEGEIEIALDGIVTLRWDNFHSMMSKKKLKYEIKVQ